MAAVYGVGTIVARALLRNGATRKVRCNQGAVHDRRDPLISSGPVSYHLSHAASFQSVT